MDYLRYQSSYARECECFTNISNQYDKNLIGCAKVSENMLCFLILIPRVAKKLILHTNHQKKNTENLGSTTTTNIGMKLLSEVYTL